MLTSYVDWGFLENLVASVLCFALFQAIKVPSPSTLVKSKSVCKFATAASAG